MNALDRYEHTSSAPRLREHYQTLAEEVGGRPFQNGRLGAHRLRRIASRRTENRLQRTNVLRPELRQR